MVNKLWKPIEEPNIICYICEKKVRDDQDSISGRSKEGKEISRHKHCGAGSPNWLKSKIAKKSKLYNLMKKIDDEKKKIND